MLKQNIKSLMLSCEGNENGKKKKKTTTTTTIGLINKKATLHVQHTFFCTFLCRCFARLLGETSRNFLVTRFVEGMSCSFSLFFHCRLFSPWWPRASRRYKISYCSSNRKCFFCSFSRWSSLACLPSSFSFSLSFSFSIFQICGHDN